MPTRSGFLMLGLMTIILSLPPEAGAQRELVQPRVRGQSFVPEKRSPTQEQIDQLQRPAGFQVDVFAQNLQSPRMMEVGGDGTVYVTLWEPGQVVALRDTNGDGRADQKRVVVNDMRGVHGIQRHAGRMYLATIREVYACAILPDGRLGEAKRIVSNLPEGGGHPKRTIGFGPDGFLYISIGSTCNACRERNPEHATILRARLDGSERQIFARGLRNTIGFGWHPQTQQMWGMDHGTDWLGDDEPPEELNRLRQGKHYGWPFVYGDRKIIPVPDRDQEELRKFAQQTEPPVLTYQAHAAPIAMIFYTGTQFPQEYRNDAFVAMRGSWNRKPAVGYEVVRIRFDERGWPTKFEPFLTGFLIENGTAHFGRPAGLAAAEDGSLLISDDVNGVIYRVSFQANSE